MTPFAGVRRPGGNQLRVAHEEGLGCPAAHEPVMGGSLKKAIGNTTVAGSPRYGVTDHRRGMTTLAPPSE